MSFLKYTPIVMALATNIALADDFKLHSTDIAHGEFISTAQVFNGFGCNGDNRSPQLSWTNAPKGTESFAVFAYDPDAPTGSGWWHWQLINIPKTTTQLNADAGKVGNPLPKGSKHITNDYGFEGFGGACPPVNDGAHRYQFTVYALPKTLNLPKNASSALAGYMVRANAIGESTIEALYKR